jgi:hypothetical protein
LRFKHEGFCDGFMSIAKPLRVRPLDLLRQPF